MRRYIILIIAFSVILTLPCKSQTVDGKNIFVHGTSGTMMFSEKIREKGPTKGSVFFKENWIPGSIVFYNGDSLHNIYVRYNLLRQHVEILQDSVFKSVPLTGINKFEIYDVLQKHFFLNSNMLNKKNDRKSSYEIVVSGKVSLLKKYFLEKIEANYNELMNVGSTDARYILRQEYYLLKEEDLVKIKTNKQSILSSLRDKKNEIKKFVSDKNLTYKEEQDIIKIFNYYNKIIVVR